MIVEIADVESDGFLDAMTKLWTIQIGRADSDEVTVYADQPGYPPLQEGIDRLKAADRVVFHNGMKFDIHAVNKIFPGTLEPEKVWDTMVGGRLLFPQYKTHSLDAWGERLKCAKGKYEGDFSKFTEELATYARQDVVVTRKIWSLLMKKFSEWDWWQSFEMECLFQYVIGLQEQNGFMLDIKRAVELESELRQELADISIKLQEVFPLRVVPKDKTIEKSYRPNKLKPLTWLGVKRKKDNPEVWEEYRGQNDPQEFPFTAITFETFNPSSRAQVADRLIWRYGWKPWKYTDAGGICIDEDVLSDLPYPEAKIMLRYLEVEKQLGQIINKGGDKGWLIFVDEETSRVHGAVNTLGAGTGRCSHFSPNMAQVNKKEPRMRECWIPRPGWKLVGVDADGLEFVCLAHYVEPFDKGKTIDRVLNGDKSKGTDVHSANRDAVIAALKTHVALPELTKDILKSLREYAKTLIYALMYGAQDPRLGVTVYEILKELGVKAFANPKMSGAVARAALGKGTPGLDKLVEGVKKKAMKRGFVKGIDGRKVFIRSEHSALNFLLQSAGAIVMKQALVIFHFELAPEAGLVHGENFGYCAQVHDEAQLEADPCVAEQVGETYARAITLAAERLGFRCPLSGSADIGDNWAETH